MVVIDFEHDYVHIDHGPLDELPPGWFLSMTYFIDLILGTIGLSSWREYLGITEESPSNWLSYKVPPMSKSVIHRPLLTFSQFLQQRRTASSSESSSTATSSNNSDNNNIFVALNDFLFKTPNTVLGNFTHLEPIVLLLILVVTLRYIKKKLLPMFCHWGRAAGLRTHGPQWVKDNEERIVKFGEYVFRLVYHSSIATFGVLILRDKNWWNFNEFRADMSIWTEYPYPIEPEIPWYYSIQGAYNVDALWSLLEISIEVKFRSPYKKDTTGTTILQSPIVKIGWAKTRRGDFTEMMVHHLATNVLLFMSARIQAGRWGVFVLCLHDISDVPVDLSKLANFLKWKITTIFMFAMMVCVWIITRLYCLPVMVLGSIIRDAHLLTELPEEPIGDFLAFKCHRFHLYVLLGTVILLHFSWFLMFVQIGLMMLTKGEAHDLTEHKKGEEQKSATAGGDTPVNVNGVCAADSSKKKD